MPPLLPLRQMCDASIPLTVGEWEEGNPNEAKYFNHMMSYSPMNNIIARTTLPSSLRPAYTTPLRTGAMKWVAAIRDVKTDDNPLLLKVDLEGHLPDLASTRRAELRYAFCSTNSAWLHPKEENLDSWVEASSRLGSKKHQRFFCSQLVAGARCRSVPETRVAF